MRKRKTDRGSQVAWGLFLIVLGVALLLGQYGIPALTTLIEHWPVVLIVWGLIDLLTPGSRCLGVFLTLLGSLLLADRLGLAPFGSTWPLFLVAAGLMWVVEALQKRGAEASRNGGPA